MERGEGGRGPTQVSERKRKREWGMKIGGKKEEKKEKRKTGKRGRTKEGGEEERKGRDRKSERISEREVKKYKANEREGTKE